MTGSIDDIIQGLEAYKKQLRAKADALAKALAEAGIDAVSIGYSNTGYLGDDHVDVTVEERGPGSYAILASGHAVLFLEFGSGVTMGYGHPEPRNYGPGTYPGQKHAMTGMGWWLPKSAGAHGGEHTYGNAPSAAMYLTGKNLHGIVTQAAREVFGR